MDPAQRESARRTHGRSVVLRLRDLDAGSLSLAGGKAANLGELISGGFPVPEGFCVTTDAYGDMAAAAGLTDIVDLLAVTSDEDQARCAGVRRQARGQTLPPPMPGPVGDGVRFPSPPRGGPVPARPPAPAGDLPFA